MNVLPIIPARRGSTRLPDKMLADIAGKPMIEWVARATIEADVGPVYVATDCDDIARAARDAGARDVIIDDECPSGTDRVFRAAERIDPAWHYETVVNIQGDMPTVTGEAIRAALWAMDDFDCGTVFSMEDAVGETPLALVSGTRALYFTRANVPYGRPHIGIYTYGRDALMAFASTAPGPIEDAERLEQFRFLENGMTIGALPVPHMIPGVDVAEDLEGARAALSA